MNVNQFILVLVIVCIAQGSCISASQQEWVLNTSNQEKLKELRRLFGQHGISLQVTSIDLKEIDAEPLIVATHKASQMSNRVLIEDTSLEVEGIDVGANLRAMTDYLIQHIDEYVGRRAAWTVFLAYREDDLVYLYKGFVAGKLISRIDRNGLSFAVLPDGAEYHDIANTKPERFDARAIAVRSFIENKPIEVRPVILEWTGYWQTYPVKP